MRTFASITVAFALSLMTGCLLDTADPYTYEMDVEWSTPGSTPNAEVSAELDSDGARTRTGSYAGTSHVVGETATPTVEICVQAQKFETVISENNISCPGACESQEWVGVTVRQCKTVSVAETHVVFELVPQSP